MEERDQLPLRLTIAAIESLKNKGYNQSQIAEMFGVSRQAVSWHKRRYGRLTPTEQVLEHFPWVVPVQLGQCTPFRAMRAHGEYLATGSNGMSEDKLRRLRWFFKRLRDNDSVVEFDLNIPPSPGIAKHGGWAYRARRDSDGDLLIRVNEHTHLTEEGRRIWRFPPVQP